MSYATSFWISQLKDILEVYPALVVLLSFRYYILLEISLVSCLSAGRLLLFTNPVVFHRLRLAFGIAILCCITFGISAFDFLYGWTVCFISLNETRTMENFKSEMRISKTIDSNSRQNAPNHLKSRKTTIYVFTYQTSKC